MIIRRVMLQIICAVGFILFLVASPVFSQAIAVRPKHVMLLHSSGQGVRPWSDYAQSIHAELERQSPWPLNIVDYSLVSVRSGDEDSEEPFVEYLRAQFSKDPLDLIVSVGAPAARFVQRYRPQLFASTPMVLSVVEQRRVDYSTLTENDAVVPVRIDYVAAFENITRVLPATKNVFVMVGRSPIEQFWKGEIRKDVMPYADRIILTFWDDLSFEDILKRAAQLPPHSAIFWELMIADAAGIVHVGDDAFLRLHAVANAPIFGYYEPNFGQGVVGGPYNAISDSGRVTATVAIRILRGEKAGDIRIPALGFASPKFDWREMQRWGISETLLPPGSKIDFRDPTAWDRYRWQIMAIAIAFLFQSTLLTRLLYEQHRRRAAEGVARERMSQLSHMNRLATAGEMSAVLAHELNQPLGAILSNAEAATLLVSSESPNLSEIRDILGDIQRDDHRASEIIRHLRSFVKKAAFEPQDLDLNHVVREVFDFVSAQAGARGVVLNNEPASRFLPVRGDRIQLQQVLLNLIVNAMDAVANLPVGKRTVVGRTALIGNDTAEVAIVDSGPGIPSEELSRIFDPFVTTKSQGMGMGLSIARTIVEEHGGKIQAENIAGGGAVFRVRLPLAQSDLA